MGLLWKSIDYAQTAQEMRVAFYILLHGERQGIWDTKS